MIEYDEVVAAMPHPTPGRRLRASHLGPGLTGRLGSLGAVTVSVRDNPAESRFEVYDDDALAGYAEYLLAGREISLTHTVVGREFKGRGLATELTGAALAQTRDRGLALLPPCSFVADFIRSNPEWLDLVPENRRAEFGL